jgi:uncharacterized membrane protein HdeD (DUF308 family)
MSTGMDAALHSETGTASAGDRGVAGQGPAGLAADPALLQDRWWTILLRGVAAIAFGLVTLIAPRTSLVVLVVAFGVYAIADGLVHLFGAGGWPREARVWVVLHGLLSLAAGAVALTWPGLAAIWLVMMIAAWAGLVGVVQIAVSMQLHRSLHGGAWLLATAGMLSIALAIALFVTPAAAVTALLWMIGIYALVIGVLLVAMGVRLRAAPHSPARQAVPA